MMQCLSRYGDNGASLSLMFALTNLAPMLVSTHQPGC